MNYSGATVAKKKPAKKAKKVKKKVKDAPVLCEACGGRIPKARLNAVPNATKCVECASNDPIIVSNHVLQQIDDNLGDCSDILSGKD